MSDIQPGDVVTYKTFGEETRTVIVVAHEADIKNGRPGFDGTVVSDPNGLETGRLVWGYDSQIVSITRPSRYPLAD